jgi:hypothetical protein
LRDTQDVLRRKLRAELRGAKFSDDYGAKRNTGKDEEELVGQHGTAVATRERESNDVW